MPPSRNDIRDDIREDAPGDTPDPSNTVTTPCPVCGQAFTPIRRQRYCPPACRQAAWRTRHPAPAPTPAVVRPPTRRHDHTVYECNGCGTRLLGQQWCPDCNRPAARLDLGGLRPHCDGPSRSATSPTNTRNRRQPADQHEPGRLVTRPPGDHTHVCAAQSHYSWTRRSVICRSPARAGSRGRRAPPWR